MYERTVLIGAVFIQNTYKAGKASYKLFAPLNRGWLVT